MSGIECPLECVKDAPSFIKENETFLLTVTATVSGIIGLLLSTCLKSRCTNIKTPCLSCDRTPIEDVVIEEPRQDLENNVN